MANNKYPEIKKAKKELLIEHFKRCDEMWRHFTPTIWSIPSVAAAINIGAYSLLFDKSKIISPLPRILILVILFCINLVLTVGSWKHRYMQRRFGDRLMDIEEKAGISVIEFKKMISGSLFYVILMVILTIISGVFLYMGISDLVYVIPKV